MEENGKINFDNLGPEELKKIIGLLDEYIKEREEERFMEFGKKEFGHLTPAQIDELIKASEEMAEEYQNCLTNNIEWPTEKQVDEATLIGIKRDEKEGKMEKKRGWLWNLFFGKYSKKNVEDRLKRNAYKPPKKLTKYTREWLEEEVRRKREGAIFFKKLKKEKYGE